ncbi:ABC transporter ATP-binding protein [Coxiella endosymbiont of Rhipicephalus microplus]|uniref:ABC transporter ATP-binding protein n=1 Tax=Coxiella endosymbiont of Rhipicephalus microplus TaxID=1656186 RepID=UPI000C80A76C|nr:ATP-binding cassette domain-containing protein [Coxiella endosymbiont of Rhipicephalus microplus]
MNKETSVIRCEKLSKTYFEETLQVSILDKVNFSVAPGESVAILGASGVGKSTFLQLLAGLDKPTTGKIWVGGKNINRLTERKKGLLRNRYLGFIYQFHYLLTEFNVLENVCIPLLVRGMKPKLAKEKAIAYVEKIGLIHRQKYQVGKLSGGEKQRIAIARALVTEPRCVLADEPTGNLDEKTADQVADLTLQLNRSLNTSFIIVTHNRLLSAKMDRIFLLEKGHLYIQEK